MLVSAQTVSITATSVANPAKSSTVKVKLQLTKGTVSEEFVGPFPSWDNLKTKYGAIGDGVADDSTAWQNALNSIGTAGHSPVLYVPSGTYKITRMLTLAHAIDISIIGRNPATTNLLWAGPAGGTILYVNGLAYSKIDRLTFNGNSSALIGVDQSKADGSSNYFDTGNEYTDDSFTNLAYGVRGGAYGYGFAETSVERAHFSNITTACVAMMNFNALDLWVWYSTFDNCNLGVTNDVPGIGGAGNYHVYYSNFTNSATADLLMGNTGGFSARGNYSSGSKWFFVNGGATNNPANIDIIGNTVLDPTSGTAVNLANQGPGLLMDNIFRTTPTGPAVQWGTFSNDQSVESIGNTFTTSNMLNVGGGQLIEIGDTTVAYDSVNPAEPSLPETPTDLSRQIFEVAVGSGAAAIQTVINKAYLQNGNRPVVHIPYGAYSVNQTVTVPPSDIQLIGDGYGVGGSGSVLNWTGSGVGPTLLINGPSKATLRDIGFGGAANSIVLSGIDQPGARIYMDQGQLGASGSTQSGLLVNGLDNAVVELQNMGINALVSVVGGSLSAAGQTTTANVNIFSGSGGSSGPYLFEVSQGGKLLVQDWWNDAGSGGPTTMFASVQGLAQFTADAVEIYQSGTGTPSLSVTGPGSTATILTAGIGSSSGISIEGDGTNTAVLGMGLLTSVATYFTDTTSPLDTAAVLNARGPSTMPGDATGPLPNIGVVNPGFILHGVAQTGSQNPGILTALPAGVSDVRLFRVAVNGVNDITIQP